MRPYRFNKTCSLLLVLESEERFAGFGEMELFAGYSLDLLGVLVLEGLHLLLEAGALGLKLLDVGF